MKIKHKMILYILLGFISILISVLLISFLNFNRKVNQEKKVLFLENPSSKSLVSHHDLEQLPELLKQYLVKTNTIGKCKDCSLIITQKGKIKAEKDKWLPFSATQYMSWKHPGFIWKANSFPILVRDKYLEGLGEVKVNLLGLKNIQVMSGDKINQGSALRYLSELAYYPQGFLDERIRWKQIDAHSVQATFQIKTTFAVSGIFYFNKEGLIETFKAKRYKETQLEDFTGVISHYKDFNGMYLPSKMKAIWSLKDGDEEYFNATIMDFKFE